MSYKRCRNDKIALGWILRCPAPPGHPHPIPDGPHRIDGRTHVQDGELVGVFINVSVVVVNDIADFLSTPVYDPIVSVEGQFISTKKVSREKSSTLQCFKHKKRRILWDWLLYLTPSSDVFWLWVKTLWLSPRISSEMDRMDTRCQKQTCLKLTVV